MKFRLSFLALFLPLTFVSAAFGDTTINPLINKGNKVIAGGGSFTHTGIDSGDSNILSLSPEVAYFIQDHLAVGTSLLFSHQFGSTSLTSFGLGPSGTYYFEKLGDGWLYVKDKFNFINVSGTSLTSSSKWTNTLSVGLNYFLSSSLSFGPSVEWEHDLSSSFPGGRSRETFRLAGSLSMHLE